MISLRSVVSLTALAVSALVFGACSDASTSPLDSTGPTPAAASFATTKTVTGTIDSRVLLDKAGNAFIEVHTGTFTDATNTGTAAGTFSSLTYTVKNGTKTVVSHTVSFDKNASSFFTRVNLCQSSANDNDGDNDDDAAKTAACSVRWAAAYTVSVTANLKGLGSDGKSSGTAAGSADVMYLPDIDLTQQALSIVTPAGLIPATTVTPSTPTTFSVPIPNNKAISGGVLGAGPIANKVGVQVSCLVVVDGLPQLPFPNGVYNKYTNPNAFGYVGSATQTIAAGATSPCQFTLSLPAGTHKIAVTAIVLYPGDYDNSNTTTATFTVNSAVVTGPTDIAAGSLQQQATSTSPIVPLGSFTVLTDAPINLVQAIQSVTGSTVGPFTCTLVLTSGTTTITKTGTTASTATPCIIPVTFTVAGTYTIQSTVSTPPGIVDAVPANNTATFTLVVTGPPSATVAAGSISYTDPYNGNLLNDLAPAATPSDTVHAGDVITYTAGINVTSLLNTRTVTVSCKVVLDGVDVTNNAAVLTWVTGPSLGAVTAGQKSCVFKLALDETDVAPHNHTITVSPVLPAGTANNATATSVTGVITNVVRVHVVAAPLQRVGDGVVPTNIVALDTTKQSTDVFFRTVISNADSHATTVNCALTANPLLQQLPGAVTSVTVPAKSSATCSFGVKATTLGSYPLSITVTPAAGAPLDPLPASGQNVASGVLTIISTGAFSQITLSGIALEQAFYDTIGKPPFPVYKLNKQHVDVNQLALLVVPAQAGVPLGDFTLTGQVINNGTTSYPIGAIRGTLIQSASGMRCGDVQTPLNQTFQPTLPSTVPSSVSQVPLAGFPSEIVYFAQVCATPTTLNGVAGFQAITIDFIQSMRGTLVNPAPKFVFGDATGGFVIVKIDLYFALTPGATPDHVTAKVRIPIPPPTDTGLTDMLGELALWTQSNTSTATIVP